MRNFGRFLMFVMVFGVFGAAFSYPVGMFIRAIRLMGTDNHSDLGLGAVYTIFCIWMVCAILYLLSNFRRIFMH